MLCAGFIDRNFEEVAEEAEALDERIVPIALQKLALTTLSLCEKRKQLISVGNSAGDITQFWPRSLAITELRMRTVDDNRVRELRRLEAGDTTVANGPFCFVDDVAVSGLTLAVAREAFDADDTSIAAVGMAMASKRLEKRAGMKVYSAIQYQQEGGGRPAVNTLATLAERSDIRRQYAVAKFGNEKAMESIIKTYERGVLL
ncbi:MAG TPA: hypothetical protein VLG36_02745 [Candidatus Chromulinivoraceae bacterium]|nr:hypothetical protein [Candidatus Chromulinivoraceae bacterium]